MIDGTLEILDGRPALRLERRLAHPVDRVWRAVTEPAELAGWFVGPVAWTPRLGETFEAEGQTGRITELDPPRTLAWTWGIERCRFDLEPDGDGCRLTFTHVLSTREQAARDAAGWHVCLDRLAQRLGGGAPDAPTAEPTAEWRGHYEAYAARGLPTGAPVPS